MTTTRITGGDRDQSASHGHTRDTTRDTAAQARSFESALARRDAAKPAAPSSPSQARPSPLSGALLSARQAVRPESRRDKADRPPGAGRADQANAGYRGARAEREDHADPSDAFQAMAGDSEVEGDARAATHGMSDADAQRDIDDGLGTRQDEEGPNETHDDSADGADNAPGNASASRDAALPANTRRSTDADSQSGGEDEGRGEGHSDRDGMARNTQAALLAALTSSAPKLHGAPSTAAATVVVDTRHPLHPGQFADAATHGPQGDADKAALRSMLDAIDALRVDIDGRGGVEMDVSVAGTQGVTVRVEEQDGCLQTTVSCRYADDALRLRPGVEKLADHLAARFARAARVRIETTSDVDNRATPNETSAMTARAGTEVHHVVAEAYAPAPSGESV